MPVISLRSRRRLRLESLEARRLLTGVIGSSPVLESEIWTVGQMAPEGEAGTSDSPSFALIADQTVEVGSPLHIPVDASGLSGGPLITTVTVGDPALVEATVIMGNRSIRIDVENFGDMVFELFEQRAPRASGRVITLAEAGFYDGIIFHRVANGFVIQAGDPTGTGMSGSTLDDFDDEFHPDLQHNREGVLSFAKTTDDTNNSQFFITETSTRNLDFNHSIFGQLVEGFDVRESISKTPVNNSVDNRPISDVVIRSIDVFDDIENSVIMLRALAANVQTDVTVTVTDQEGNFVSQTFAVSTIADAVNANPYLKPISSRVLAPSNEIYSLSLDAIDLESDPVRFAGQYSSDSFGSTATLNSNTGLFEITPAAGFTGSIDFLFGVTSAVANNLPFDTQSFQLEFIDAIAAPSMPDLVAASDSGALDSDNVTSESIVTIAVSGATVGTTVELVDSVSGVVLASAMASSNSVELSLEFPEELPGGDYSIFARSRLGSLISDPSLPLIVHLDRTGPTIDSATLAEHGFAGEPVVAMMTADETIAFWSIIDGSDSIAIDATTGSLQWTPPLSTRGVQRFTVGSEDLAGNVTTLDLTIQITSRYANLVNPFDVDGSGEVSSRDALLIINALSRGGGAIALPEFDFGSMTGQSTLRQDYFYNTNHDDAITALDVLIVINEIGRRQASGESERATTEFLESVDTAVMATSTWIRNAGSLWGVLIAGDRNFDDHAGRLF